MVSTDLTFIGKCFWVLSFIFKSVGGLGNYKELKGNIYPVKILKMR